MTATTDRETGPIVISVANQKGGVGKTTTAVNLAAGLTMHGYRVLVLDLDIQANATHILYRQLKEDEIGLAEVILEETTLDEIIKPTTTENLLIACSGETMVRVDLALAGMLGREEALKRILKESKIAAEQDFIIIDTSPYLGLLTVNALVTSHEVLIPVSCEYLPILGLKLFLTTINTIRKRLNEDIHILGYLLTMFDRRENITFEVENMMRNHFKDEVFSHPIRVNTRHKSSPAHHQTIFQYETKSGRGVEDYARLTRNVLRRLNMPLNAEDVDNDDDPIEDDTVDNDTTTQQNDKTEESNE